MTALTDGAVPLLHDCLLQSAVRLPNKVAVVCKGAHVSYGEVNAASNALAHALVRRGVNRGDRVIVFADNTVEAAIAFWAVLKANAVVSVVNPLTKAEKLAYLLNDCRATALITDAHLAGVYQAAVERSPHLHSVIVSGRPDEKSLSKLPGGIGWEAALAAEDHATPPVRAAIDVDLAAIVYTSGSTGDPKGVMLTHRNMLTAATSVSSYLGLREDDVVLMVLPMAFDYGLYQMIMSFRVGARLVIERSFTLIDHHGAALELPAGPTT